MEETTNSALALRGFLFFLTKGEIYNKQTFSLSFLLFSMYLGEQVISKVESIS